jgi:hypothetical protein
MLRVLWSCSNAGAPLGRQTQLACLASLTINHHEIERKRKNMTRKIITAVAGLSLFVGVAMAQAATPATSGLKGRSVLDASASAGIPEKVAYYSGYPGANVATSTNIGIAGIAIGTSGSVAQSSVAQAGGYGNVGVATANAGGFHGRGGHGRGHGGWRRIALNDAPASGQADILFDN